MNYSKAKRDYNTQYIKDNIKRIPLDVQKDKFEEIKAAADASGESVNGYIKRAVDGQMNGEIHLPDDLQAAVRSIAALTGETVEEVVARNVAQNLHSDIDNLVMGYFLCKDYPSSAEFEALNNLVVSATGISADKWIMEKCKEDGRMSDESREYVIQHSSSNTIMPHNTHYVAPKKK